MSMTRKDYRQFATLLAKLRNEGFDPDTLWAVESGMVHIFAADNQRFSRETFAHAASPQ